MPKLILFFVLVSTIVISGAPSNPPAPSPVKTSQPPQTKAAAQEDKSSSNQQGSDSLPFVVKLIAPTPTTNETGNTTAKQHQESSADWWTCIFTGLVAIFTLCLAVFTFLLWRSTDKLWKASTVQSEDMKKSLAIAKESADSTRAMVETMKDTAARELRAYIGLIGFDIEKNGVKATYVNRGATPAHKVISGGWYSIEKSLTPKEIRDYFAKNAKSFDAAGSTVWKDIETSILIGIDDMETLKGKSTFVCGMVIYYDIFDAKQTLCFQSRMSFAHGNWYFETWPYGNEAS